MTTWHDCYVELQAAHKRAEDKLVEMLQVSFEYNFAVKCRTVEVHDGSVYVDVERIEGISPLSFRSWLSDVGLQHLYEQEEGMPPGTWRFVL
jgi:hypothetical protein